ncbi:hypothetical protein [Stutzerimonas balearica]|uniref:hypothetical protein n=1 Tax=Stutzerimonas balearica TaxID=74829 RepID=UPI00289BAEBB|nr:hypothetical protein [Stutzerimonas balearica]
MQHTDKAIAEFEAWWDRQPHCEQFEDLKQQFCNVAVAFYQKGREGVVVELPSDPNEEFSDRRAAVYACRLAIEAAGVTVRG